MWKCTWTPNNTPIDSATSKLRIYDAGEYVGFLYNNVWRCWRVTERKKLECHSILEELFEMDQDWVPYQLYSEEEYPLHLLRDEPLQFEMAIPGWTLQGLKVERPPEQSQPLSHQVQKPLQSNKEGSYAAQGRRELVQPSASLGRHPQRPSEVDPQLHLRQKQESHRRQGGQLSYQRRPDPSLDIRRQGHLSHLQKGSQVQTPF